MRRIALLTLMLWAGGGMAGAPPPAEGSPEDLIRSLLQANAAGSFRLHAQLTRSRPSADGYSFWRLFIAGRGDGPERQLLVRALLPDALAGASLEARLGPGAALRAVSYRAGSTAPPVPVDPQAALFGSSLSLWELLGAWWSWPQQTRVGRDTVLGQDCVVIESSGGSGRIVRVRSWIAPALRLPLRMDFFDRAGSRVQMIEADKLLRRPDGSALARALRLTDADGVQTRMEVYSGQEHAELSPSLFRLPQTAPDTVLLR